MQGKSDQNGFIMFILLIVVAVLSVMVYSFIKQKAREQGFELPFGL
jgi:uncharacterized membrane protein YsdA (DUF1294 family)